MELNFIGVIIFIAVLSFIAGFFIGRDKEDK